MSEHRSFLGARGRSRRPRESESGVGAGLGDVMWSSVTLWVNASGCLSALLYVGRVERGLCSASR
jgi:hypothetical protein